MVSSGLLLRCQTRYVSESFLRVGSLEEDRNVAGCVEISQDAYICSDVEVVVGQNDRT